MTEQRNLARFATISNAAFNSISANSTAILSMSVGGHTINATSFAGTANNASNLGGVAAASYALLASPSFTGNVGIGTASPGTKLDIYDAASAGSPAVRIRDNVSDLRLYPSGGGSYIATISDTPLIFNTNNAEQMRIVSNGNIGIGTSDPTINGGVGARVTIVARSGSTTGLALAANTTQLSFAINPATNGSWTMFDRAANGGIGVWTAGITQSNGNVGIGMTPGTKLDVDGIIRATGSSAGSVVLNPGSNTNPGYVGFFTAEGTRRGYIGWGGSNNLLITSENGWNYNFSQAPLVSGNIVLHAGNFTSYSPGLTGSGASGNWGINITGNAATVTNGVYTSGDQTIGNTKNFNGSLRNIVSSGWSNFYLGGQFNKYAWFHIGGETGSNDLRIARINRDTLGWEANPFVFDLAGGISYATGSMRAPVFFDTDDTNSYYEGSSLFMRGSAPTIYFRDTDHNSAMIHCNGNLLYVLRGGNDTTSWSTVRNGNWPVFFNLTNNDLYCGGDIYAVVNVVAYASDKRLKENIKEIPNAIEKIKMIRGVTFDWSDKIDSLGFTPKQKYDDVGVIAQEIEEVLPQVVAPAPFDIEYDEADRSIIKSKSGENYKTVQYERVVPLLIQAIKEQQAQIEALQAKIMEIK